MNCRRRVVSYKWRRDCRGSDVSRDRLGEHSCPLAARHSWADVPPISITVDSLSLSQSVMSYLLFGITRPLLERE